jgi:hypothetical protein
MKSESALLSSEHRIDLLEILRTRFNKHPKRHSGISFADIGVRLSDQPEKLRSLYEMEKTGGEPDVVGIDQKSGEVIFFDCSVETPKDRRNVCYDREALDKRKQYKPENTAMDMANAMGVELLTEQQYHYLQTLGDFDTKTSSWLKTPPEIRKLGGAIFGDKRYGHVFIYHNGADSYYGVRGFRGCLRV